MADVLRLKGVFPANTTNEYIITGEVRPANNLYIRVYLWSPGVGVSMIHETGGRNGWSRFRVTTTVDGSQYTGLIVERADDGPGGLLVVPGATSTTYFRNISAVRYVPANVSTTDILNAGRLNHAYNGCKMTALDFNVPSPDTPDGGPVVEINFVNPNSPTAAPAELDELDAALYTARTGRALVNIVPQPDPNPSSSERTVDPARALANRSSERAVDPGRAIINRSGEGRRLVNVAPPPVVEARALANRNTTNNSNNT